MKTQLSLDDTTAMTRPLFRARGDSHKAVQVYEFNSSELKSTYTLEIINYH